MYNVFMQGREIPSVMSCFRGELFSCVCLGFAVSLKVFAWNFKELMVENTNSKSRTVEFARLLSEEFCKYDSACTQGPEDSDLNIYAGRLKSFLCLIGEDCKWLDVYTFTREQIEKIRAVYLLLPLYVFHRDFSDCAGGGEVQELLKSFALRINVVFERFLSGAFTIDELYGFLADYVRNYAQITYYETISRGVNSL